MEREENRREKAIVIWKSLQNLELVIDPRDGVHNKDWDQLLLFGIANQRMRLENLECQLHQ